MLGTHRRLINFIFRIMGPSPLGGRAIPTPAQRVSLSVPSAADRSSVKVKRGDTPGFGVRRLIQGINCLSIHSPSRDTSHRHPNISTSRSQRATTASPKSRTARRGSFWGRKRWDLAYC